MPVIPGHARERVNPESSGKSVHSVWIPGPVLRTVPE